MKKLKVYLDAVWAVIIRSPVEIIISVVFFGIFLFLRSGDFHSYSHMSDLLYYFIICLAVSYSANIIFSEKRRFGYYLTILLAPIIFLVISILEYEMDFTPLAITTICSILLIFVSKNLTDNREFVRHAMIVVKNLLITTALISIATLIAQSVISSIYHIFKYELSIEAIMGLFFFLFSPILFLVLEYRDRKAEVKITHFMNILFNYILAPSIVIYGLILYVYFARIAFLWELPKGVISTTAMVFLIGGIFVSACRTVFDKKTLNWAFDYFTYIAIPTVVIFWVSALTRILEYGLTGDRVYLLITLITLTLWLVVTLVKKYAKFQYLGVFIILIYMVFTLVPGISYEDFNRRAKEKDGIEGAKTEIFYSHFKSSYVFTVDIEGYKYFTDLSMSYTGGDSGSSIINDTLIIKESGKQIYKGNINDILDEMFANGGLENYRSASERDIEDHIKKMDVYKNDDVIIQFDYIKIKRSTIKSEYEKSFSVLSVDVEWIVTK